MFAPQSLDNGDVEDPHTFITMLANRGMIDTYLSLRDEYSGPMMMTNRSVKYNEEGEEAITYKRLDRCYHTPMLEGSTLIDMINSKYRALIIDPLPLHNPQSQPILNIPC